tara:strand:+ start:1151 stop:2080 length:930 start_codon:yes stop_codon:yes gene_type:complete
MHGNPLGGKIDELTPEPKDGDAIIDEIPDRPEELLLKATMAQRKETARLLGEKDAEVAGLKGRLDEAIELLDEVKESERKLGKENNELKEELAMQNEAIKELGSILSHDHNNALSSTIGFTDLMIDHPERMDEKNLKIVQSSANSAKAIVDRVAVAMHEGRMEELITTINEERKLPAEQSEAAQEDDEKESVETLHKTRTILVVDDEKTPREVIVEMLKVCGHTVVEASNANEAIEAMSSGNFGMIICDFNMPADEGGNGDVVAKKAAELEIPIVILSGLAVTLDERALKEIGVKLVASKPVAMKTLQG